MTWRLLEHWEDVNPGAYGDRAIFASVNLYGNGPERMEDAYVVEEVTTDNLPTVEGAYGITNITHTYRMENGEPLNDDYEYNDDALYYWNGESAVRKAREEGAADWSNEFNAMEVRA